MVVAQRTSPVRRLCAAVEILRLVPRSRPFREPCRCSALIVEGRAPIKSANRDDHRVPLHRASKRGARRRKRLQLRGAWREVLNLRAV